MVHRSPFQKIVRLGIAPMPDTALMQFLLYLYNFNLYKSLRGYLQADIIHPYLSIDLEELLCYNSKDIVY